MTRAAHTRVLREAGFHVIEAATGQAALQLVAEHCPALVILDIGLPDIDGFEVCRNHTPAFKAKVALAAMKGDAPTEPCYDSGELVGGVG